MRVYAFPQHPAAKPASGAQSGLHGQCERAIEIGRKLIEKEARKYRIALKSINDEDMMRVSQENGLAKPDDLLVAIGYGKFSARSILARLVPAEEAQSFSGHAPPAPATEDDGNGFTSVVRRVREALNPALHVSGVLVTMFDGRTRLAMEVLDELEKFFPQQMFKTQIPRNVRLSEAPSFGKPVILFDVKSRGAQAYLALAREMLEPAEVHA